jgi:hypothetical protein
VSVSARRAKLLTRTGPADRDEYGEAAELFDKAVGEMGWFSLQIAIMVEADVRFGS